ncbi:hypothetical protein A4X13_0g3827 [Tilletia indica]|uniref:Origin recognition complex subunit 2 RecA-like domain-containing protein n=1 Tax=Tilletia indica TaxID=43049 RepID=A0A177T7X5_9BASI|nr:hypothetical protein A4X13_0g3827 [Tilletia indica]
MKTRSRGGGGSAEDDDKKKGTAPTPPPPAKKRGRQPKPKTEELESTPSTSSSSSAPTAKRRRTLPERTTTTAKKSTPSSDRKVARPETPPPPPASSSNSSTSIPHHQPIRNESSPHASALIAVEIVSPSKRLAPAPNFQPSSPSAQNAPRYAIPQLASSATTAALTQELTAGPLIRPSADAGPPGGGSGSGSAKGKEKAKTAADARRMEKGLKSLPPLVDQRNSWLLGKSKTSGTPPSASSVRSGGRTPPQTRGGMARGPASITPTASRLTRASELGNSSSSSSRTHRPSPLGSGRTTSILPRAEDDDDDVFSEDDLPANASASMLERITKGIEADLQGTPSLIRPSSSDAFFLAFSPSARTASTLASATSTPRGGGKKRARLADGIDAVGTTSSSGNDGAGAEVGPGGGNISSGNAVLSMKVGTIRSTATRGLLPRRRAGASDEEEDEEDEEDDDAGDEDAALRRWKRVWGTVNVPPRPKLHPSMKLAVGGKGKSKATTTSTKQNPFKTFVPPFATHTLLALSTAHFRADSSSVPKYAFNTSSHKSGGRRQIRGDDSEEEEEESYSPNSVFAFWLSQLQAGFSLVFYGVGIGALPDTLPRPPRSLPAPLFKSQPSMLHTKTSGIGDGIRAPLRPRPQHLLETFVRDVCEAGHGCAWIGHGMAPSSSSSGAGGGGRASGGLKIEDVLSGCEGAVRTGWGRRPLEEEGEGESDEDEEREGVSRKKVDSGLPPLGTGANKAELRAQRLVSIFSCDLSPTDEDDDDGDSTSNFPPALFILIHSLDAPSLIQPKVQRILAILGSAPRIHLLGTVRNVNAGLAVPFGSGAGGGEASGLTSSLGGGNKGGGVQLKGKGKGKAKVVNVDEDETMEEEEEEEEDGDEEANEKGTVSAPRRQQQQQQRLRWIWHSISTFLPSLPEALTARHGALVGGVPSVLDFSGRGGAGASASALRTLGESSAHSILRSVSKKCRSLFLILAWEQLRRYPARANPDAKTQEQEDEDCPVSVERLIELASAQFVASNVNELGPLLKEFETHHLVERGVDPGPPPESWITIKLERALLEKVLKLLDGDKLNEVGVHVQVLEEAAKGGK